MLKTLEALEAEIDESFSILNHPPKPFVPLIKGPDGKLMLDVLIIGGGMNGLAAAFALRRFGVLNIRQLDAKPAGFAGRGEIMLACSFLDPVKIRAARPLIRPCLRLRLGGRLAGQIQIGKPSNILEERTGLNILSGMQK